MNFNKIGFYGDTQEEVLAKIENSLAKYKQIIMELPKLHVKFVKQILDDKGIKYNLEADNNDCVITIVKEIRDGK